VAGEHCEREDVTGASGEEGFVGSIPRRVLIATLSFGAPKPDSGNEVAVPIGHGNRMPCGRKATATKRRIVATKVAGRGARACWSLQGS
jgi:hypothetical protein